MVSARPVLDPRVFDGAAAAVALVVGPEHRLIYTNTVFTRLFGVRRLGLPAVEAFPDPDGGRFLGVLDDVRASGRGRQVDGARDPGPQEPGQARHFVYSCSPAVTARGPGVLVVAMDTTEATQALQRYEALASAVSQTVWLMRPDGTMREILPGWERLTGTPWRPRADSGWSEVIHPRDIADVGRAWEAAAGADPPEVFEYTFRVRTAGDGFRHMFSRAVPILREGRVMEWISATADVEEAWRAGLRERLLTSIAADTVIGSSTALNRAFQAVAGTVVPRLVDACLILTLAQPQWPLAEPEAPTEGRAATRIATAVRPGLPLPPPLEGHALPLSPAMRQALDRREPQTMTFPAGAVPPYLVPDATARWLSAIDATSLTLLPLIVADAVYGYAVTITCDNTPPPGNADVELLDEILHHAQQPVRTLLDHQQTRRTALDLQRAHLTTPPRIPGAQLAACYQPASTTTGIGGDWYDAFTLPGDTLLLYTDGLIETPTTSLADGQERLAREGSRRRRLPLTDLLDHLQQLSDHRDDTALIAFRVGVAPPPG